jgi:hypothetical protein
MSQPLNEIIFKHAFHDLMGRFPIEGTDFFYEECADDNAIDDNGWRNKGISRAKNVQATSKTELTAKQIQDYTAARATRISNETV